MGDLSANFSRSEFACTCGCGENKIDPVFVSYALQALRYKIGRIDIVEGNGFRCPKRNEKAGGKKDSAHLLGLAADLIPRDVPLWVAVMAAFQLDVFTGIGFGESNLHVDRKPGPFRFWCYPSKKKTPPFGQVIVEEAKP